MAKPKKKAEKSAALSLQQALSFCAVAYKVTGDPYQTHVLLNGGWVTAFNGVIAAGYPCGDCPQCAPNGAKLATAIDRSGALNIALDGSMLAVTAGRFSATVACLPIGTVAPPHPDPPMLQTGDALRLALGEVAHLAASSGATVLESSLLIDAHVISATNRVVVMQVMHGFQLPSRWVIPRDFATAVIKAGEPMIGIGWSDRTFTAYFESGAWMRTQLYQEDWPDVNKVFMAEPALIELPSTFFPACEALLPFADDYSKLQVVKDAVIASNGKYTCDGLPDLAEPTFLSGKLLALIAGRVNKVDWTSSDRAVFFYGDTVRAAVMRMKE